MSYLPYATYCLFFFFHPIYLTSYILYMSRSLSLYLIYLISIYKPFFIFIPCVAHIYIPFYILISRMPYRSHYLSASSLFYHTSCLCFFIFAFSLPIPYIFFLSIILRYLSSLPLLLLSLFPPIRFTDVFPNFPQVMLYSMIPYPNDILLSCLSHLLNLSIL